MQAPNLRVSLVIPAFNEEQHLPACLDAISRQTVKPYEVIIVDNNSTDNTLAVARSYPFVKVVSESRQGVVYARDAGFNAAHGDIIGRVDADTRIPKDWIVKLSRIFEDKSTDAATGPVIFYDAPFKNFFAAGDKVLRSWLWKRLSRRNEMFLFGCNMAIRRSAWQAVRNEVCHEHSKHEDIDLSAHMAHKHKVMFYEQLVTRVSGRCIDQSARQIFKYFSTNGRTYKSHNLKGSFYMYIVAGILIIASPVLRSLYRSYDIKTKQIKFMRIFRYTDRSRVSPLSEVL